MKFLVRIYLIVIMMFSACVQLDGAVERVRAIAHKTWEYRKPLFALGASVLAGWTLYSRFKDQSKTKQDLSKSSQALQSSQSASVLTASTATPVTADQLSLMSFRGNGGYTHLMFACKNCDLALVNQLLTACKQNNSYCNQKNDAGQTALDIVCATSTSPDSALEFKSIARALIAAGAQPAKYSMAAIEKWLKDDSETPFGVASPASSSLSNSSAAAATSSSSASSSLSSSSVSAIVAAVSSVLSPVAPKPAVPLSSASPLVSTPLASHYVPVPTPTPYPAPAVGTASSSSSAASSLSPASSEVQKFEAAHVSGAPGAVPSSDRLASTGAEASAAATASSSSSHASVLSPQAFSARSAAPAPVVAIDAKTRQAWFKAAQEGDVTTMQQLLKENSALLDVTLGKEDIELLAKDFDVRGYDGSTALLLAARKGCFSGVEFLVNNKANVNHQNLTKRTPLRYAAYYAKNNQIAQFLIENGAQANAQDIDGNTPFMEFCAWYGSSENDIKLLLTYTELAITNNEGNNALMLASKARNVEIVDELIKRKFDCNQKNNAGETALDIACAESFSKYIFKIRIPQYKDTARKLIAAGAQPAKYSMPEIEQWLKDDSATPFNPAAATSSSSSNSSAAATASSSSVAKGPQAQKEAASSSSSSSGVPAASQGFASARSAAPAPVVAIDAKTRQAWFKAAQAGDVKKMGELLESEPKLIEATIVQGDLKSLSLEYNFYVGHTALCWASCEGKLSTVKFLVNNKANVHANQNVLKQTPLMQAADSKIARCLVEHGADLNKQDFNGDTALMLLCSRFGTDLDFFNILLNNIGLTITNKDKDNILMIACRRGQDKYVDALLGKVDLSQKNSADETALDIVCRGSINCCPSDLNYWTAKYKSMARKLIAAGARPAKYTTTAIDQWLKDDSEAPFEPAAATSSSSSSSSAASSSSSSSVGSASSSAYSAPSSSSSSAGAAASKN